MGRVADQMPEFLELVPPHIALNTWMAQLPIELEAEEISSDAGLGRVTISPVISDQPLPAFTRSTVDGYAVRAEDSYGASESLPAYLSLVGEIPMGGLAKYVLLVGQCALIHTGGMLPTGANAVVMLEHTQIVRPGEVEILRAVAAGENTLQVGEDVRAGEPVIPAGTKLRPVEIGGLMALGYTRLQVVRKPRVGILSSGDEVVPPGTVPNPGQVRDVNAYTLSALVEAAGGVPIRYGIVTDDAAALDTAVSKALPACDLLVITAGSSASARDLTAEAINRLGQPGILVHGVNIRPGKPTILAVCDGKGVIGLPGNPVSALVIAWLFVTPAVEALSGLKNRRQRQSRTAHLASNLPSQAGREDWVPVKLVEGKHEIVAEPVYGKSNLIFTLVRADGLVRIPPDVTGLNAGELVEVVFL